VDPSSPVYWGKDARSWDSLKNHWGEIRKEITLVHKNYMKSGSMDPQDTSDVYNFCDGNTWLCYIYLAALRRSNGGYETVEVIAKTRGSETNSEDGVGEGEGQIAGSSSVARKRKALGGSGGQAADAMMDKEGFRLAMMGKALDCISAAAGPPPAQAMAQKKMEIEADTKNKEEDRYAALLKNPNCPPALGAKLEAHFMSSLGDM